MDTIKCTHCEENNPIRNKYCSNCGYELPKTVVENVDHPIQPKPQKTNTRKVVLLVIVYAVAFGLSYLVVQQLFFKTAPLDQTMMAAASEINKNCPLMIDSETRLDNAVSLPQNVFQYNYTLLNIDKASTDTLEMRKYLEPTIINSVKTNPQMKFQRDHKTTINYFYKDKSGAFLLLISVTPEKYQ